MKLWESEHFTLNFETGELERVVSDIYFQGTNMEHAQTSLIKSKQPHLRLTGNWLEANTPDLSDLTKVYDTEEAEVIKLDVEDEEDEESEVDLDKVEDFIKSKSLDEFLDWLDVQPRVIILALLETTKAGNLDAYVKTIEGHLKNKYGS